MTKQSVKTSHFEQLKATFDAIGVDYRIHKDEEWTYIQPCAKDDIKKPFDPNKHYYEFENNELVGY